VFILEAGIPGDAGHERRSRFAPAPRSSAESGGRPRAARVQTLQPSSSSCDQRVL